MSGLPPLDTSSALLRALGKILHRLAEDDSKSGVFHLMHLNRLRAHIVKNEPRLGLHPLAQPGELEESAIKHRPSMARAMPTGFVPVITDYALWTFALSQRDDVNLNTMRRLSYRFVRFPELPFVALTGRQIAILSWFRAQPDNCLSPWKHVAKIDAKDPRGLAGDVRALLWCGALETEAPGDSAEAQAWPEVPPGVVSQALHWLNQAAKLNRSA